MGNLLAVLASGRKKGYTANLLAEAVEGAKSVEGVKIEIVYLIDYKFGPCNSCFNCIRDPNHVCTQKDDFGNKGEGILFKKVKDAGGILLADAVHFWGPTARAHLFIERCYPIVWSGAFNGMPFASISCASNQGMHMLANREMCKWAFTLGMRYIKGLPVHVAYMERAMAEARYLGQRIAEAVKTDEVEGRKKLSDEERFLYYMDKPWSVFMPYMENLSDGSFKLEKSLIETSLSQHTFKMPEAIELLEKSREEFKEAIRYYNMNEYEQANKHLVQASAYWTHATWKEFLEAQVVRSAVPKVYRPLGEGRVS